MSVRSLTYVMLFGWVLGNITQAFLPRPGDKDAREQHSLQEQGMGAGQGHALRDQRMAQNEGDDDHQPPRHGWSQGAVARPEVVFADDDAGSRVGPGQSFKDVGGTWGGKQ